MAKKKKKTDTPEKAEDAEAEEGSASKAKPKTKRKTAKAKAPAEEKAPASPEEPEEAPEEEDSEEEDTEEEAEETAKAEKKKAKKRAKRGRRSKKDDEAEEEEAEEEKEAVGYTPKLKPELDEATKAGLALRSQLKSAKPRFRRQEWFRYKKLGENWRRPRGNQSKMRIHKGYRQNVVSVGYGSPARVRGLHPSGFREVMVYNPRDLEGMDPKVQAARIGHSVGVRKRVDIEERAEELGIRILNRRMEL